MINKNTKAFLAIALSLGSLSADLVHPNGCKGPNLCTSKPIIDGCGWFAEMGVIFEQMRISHTDVLWHGVGGGAGTYADPATNNRIYDLSFGLDAGITCSLGYHTDFDDWQGKANFQWLSSAGSFSLRVDNGNLYPTYFPYQFYSTSSINEISFVDAKCTLNVDYFLFELMLSRGSYISRNFSYEPFVALQGSWIYANGSRQFFQASTVENPMVSWHQIYLTNFFGCGPMVGTYGQYYIMEGWSIYSQGQISVLFGNHYIKSTFGFVTVEKPQYQRNRGSQVAVSPTIRTLFGLRYDRDLFNDSHHFAFKAGFDGRCYFNQYPIYASQPKKLQGTSVSKFVQGPYLVDNGTFGMIGLILELGYDF